MGTLSEAYGDYPHHITPLDFSSIQKVPDSHAWDPSDHHLQASSSPSASTPRHTHGHDEHLLIPVVDLAHPEAARLVGEASETWGMFQLINHGIPSQLLEEVELKARELFSLPASRKVKALRSPSGVTGYGIARISPFFPKYMWHEGFTIMGSPLDHAKELWPNGYERFCNVMEDYQRKMQMLAEHLTRLLLKFLDIPEDQRRLPDPPCTALQLNSYPACPDPDRVMGLAPHTDTSLLTLLHQSDTCGLQVFHEEVGWVSVGPAPGTLVVNVGDVLHILSNGRFRNVLHRVVVNQARHRVSLAYFYSPATDFRVGPLPELLGPGDTGRYRVMELKEYIGIKAKNLEKALSLIRN